MEKNAYSAQEKFKIIVAYEDRQTSVSDFCHQYSISTRTLNDWIYLFQTYGKSGLQGSEGWKRYTKEVKYAAVLDYLSGEYSRVEIIRKYEISSRSVLKRWIKNYNDLENSLEHVLSENTKKHLFKSKTVMPGNDFEVTYEVRIKETDIGFINHISTIEGVKSAVMLSYDGNFTD